MSAQKELNRTIQPISNLRIQILTEDVSVKPIFNRLKKQQPETLQTIGDYTVIPLNESYLKLPQQIGPGALKLPQVYLFQQNNSEIYGILQLKKEPARQKRDTNYVDYWKIFFTQINKISEEIFTSHNV